MIGILGGTFDPIHLGHLLAANIAHDRLKLERVLFTPAGDPPHKKDADKSPAHHRRRLVELAIAGNPAFELCPVDLDRPGPHYSVDTIRLIRSQYDLSAEHCFFIMGGDSLSDLPAWHKPQQLIRLCRLAVAHRPGYRPNLDDLAANFPDLKTRLNWIEMPLMEISSTAIRQQVKQGQSIRYQTVDAVIEYIRGNGLYKT